jgi:hypothetical protein
MAATGSPPTPAGGTIADGTYQLTKIENYPPSTRPTSSVKYTYRVAGNQLEAAFAATNPLNDATSNFSISTAGTTLMLNRTCGSLLGISGSYTATTTTLLILDISNASNQVVWTFTKE